jgi:hypothetical protein
MRAFYCHVFFSPSLAQCTPYEDGMFELYLSLTPRNMGRLEVVLVM